MTHTSTLAPVRLRPLAAEAWGLFTSTWPRLWPVWLAGAVLTAAAYAAVEPLTGGDVWTMTAAEGFAFDAAYAVVWAVAGAFAMPVILARPEASWRRAAYASLLGALGFVGSAIVVLMRVAGDGLQPIGSAALWALGVACWLFIVWLSLRIALWPVGVLTRDPRLTLRGGWIATRGGLAAFFALTLAVELPLSLVSWLCQGRFFYLRSLPDLAVSAAAEALVQAAAFALVAAYIRQRFDEALAETAATFD